MLKWLLDVTDPQTKYNSDSTLLFGFIVLVLLHHFAPTSFFLLLFLCFQQQADVLSEKALMNPLPTACSSPDRTRQR